MTEKERAAKAAKRARNDARTAWRKMTPAMRGEFLAWIAEDADLPIDYHGPAPEGR